MNDLISWAILVGLLAWTLGADAWCKGKSCYLVFKVVLS